MDKDTKTRTLAQGPKVASCKFAVTTHDRVLKPKEERRAMGGATLGTGVQGVVHEIVGTRTH